jgi:hypothetical protein
MEKNDKNIQSIKLKKNLKDKMIKLSFDVL